MMRSALACACFAALLLCVACGDARPQQPGGESPAGVAATLGSVGVALTWAGGIGAAAGVCLSLIAMVYPPLGFLAAVFRFAAVGGAGVLATGSSIQFLAAYPWIMGLAILGTISCTAWVYRGAIRRFIVRASPGVGGGKADVA